MCDRKCAHKVPHYLYTLIVLEHDKMTKLKIHISEKKNIFRIIPKAHAYLQNMTKTSVKFKKDQPTQISPEHVRPPSTPPPPPTPSLHFLQPQKQQL